MANENRNVQKISKTKNPNILKPTKLSRALNSEDYPNIVNARYFKDKRNDDLDNKVPRWDISFKELTQIYDEARFNTYLDWDLKKYKTITKISFAKI